MTEAKPKPSYIPTYVIYDNTKFGNDSSALGEEDTYRIKKKRSKDENMLQVGLFQGQYPTWKWDYCLSYPVKFVFFYFSNV